MNIYEKLNDIQQRVDTIVKNKKGFNFTYANGEAVLAEIRPLMVSNKLLCYPVLKGGKSNQITYNSYEIDKQTKKIIETKEKREFLYNAAGSWVWLDTETGDKLEIEWDFAGNSDDASQAQGNALTYNERYFLLKFFKVPTPDSEPDAKKLKDKMETKTDSITKLTDEQKKQIELLFADLGDTVKANALSHYKVASIDELNILNASDMIQVLKAKAK